MNLICHLFFLLCCMALWATSCAAITVLITVFGAGPGDPVASEESSVHWECTKGPET